MGKKRKDDLCPKCASKSHQVRAAQPQKPLRFEPLPVHPVQIVTTLPIAPKEHPMTAEIATITPPPRSPSREDKRLIILAIEDHYLGPDKGYAAGVTDATVAANLNVPAKWVADLREEFFGPLVNPEFSKLAAELGQLTNRLDAHEREGRELRTKLMDLKERLAKATGGGRQ